MRPRHPRLNELQRRRVMSLYQKHKRGLDEDTPEDDKRHWDQALQEFQDEQKMVSRASIRGGAFDQELRRAMAHLIQAKRTLGAIGDRIKDPREVNAVQALTQQLEQTGAAMEQLKRGVVA